MAQGSSKWSQKDGELIIFRRSEEIIHPNQWSARSLRRVSCSTSLTKILSDVDAISPGLYVEEWIDSMLSMPETEITVNSNSLLALSASLKVPEKSYTNVYLAKLFGVLGDSQPSAVHWILSFKLLAGYLKKNTLATAALLFGSLPAENHTCHPR